MRRAIFALVAAAAVIAAGLVAGAPAVASSSPAPEPVVRGNHLIDSRTGDVFVPHGVNYPGFEYACPEGWGYSQGTETQAAADAMVAWRINIVRLPLSEDCWLGKNNANNPNHQYGTAAGYQAAVHAWVTMLNNDGIAVILDLHYAEPDNGEAYGQYPMADLDNAPAFWTSIASAYKSDPSIIFDAFNEPYSIWSGDNEVYTLTWNCWENGGASCRAPTVGEDQEPDGTKHTYQIAGMQQLVNAIRAGGATQPIMLGGIDYSNDLTGWLAHEPSDPVDGPAQLVASWHNYPGQVCDHLSCWNSEILPVAAHVPVIAGEFGDDNASTDFMTPFMNWADAHGIGYLPWAWWHLSTADGDDPSALIYSMYKGSDFTPVAPEGTSYYAHLQSLVSIEPAPISNVGGGVQLGTAPRQAQGGGNPRGLTVAQPPRSSSGRTAASTGAQSAASSVPRSLTELAALLAGAPAVSSEFCAYG